MPDENQPNQNQPDQDQPDDLSNDPRNDEVKPGGGMPAEFIDTPENRPGDQSPPNPAHVDDA